MLIFPLSMFEKNMDLGTNHWKIHNNGNSEYKTTF